MLQDIKLIDKDVNWLLWAGGEYIGGNSDFFKALYEDIIKFKENYWAVVHNGLFHIGDEMLTSIALTHLRKQNIYPINAYNFKAIYRYWSGSERQPIKRYNTALIHLPGSKTFIKDMNLNAKSVDELFKGFENYRRFEIAKGTIKKIVHKIIH